MGFGSVPSPSVFQDKLIVVDLIYLSLVWLTDDPLQITKQQLPTCVSLILIYTITSYHRTVLRRIWMIKVVYCIQKPDDTDSREFDRYWSTEIQLLKYLGKSLTACRCVYSRTILPEVNDAFRRDRPGMQPPYEGILEYWWKSREDLKQGMRSIEARAASAPLLEDEKRIIDYSGSRLFVTEEHVIFE